ncbi:YIP1 family protein [Natronolimnohabitans innermongolicus]|uniref:Uncharacterized protein n=1 Tax=Natronolimnohabitans innermongolicus JCM 12255 TaxID=1227499 RepID=L9WQG7_9EURY|nr:YIP1 family protein [Natronolimnohabitans innermongolicus]ELY51729.1 hypothetical protein C493_17406 [Natronolimnohabitans innermongolicus JCM 12255]
MSPKTPLLGPAEYFASADDPLPVGMAVFALYVLATVGLGVVSVALLATQPADPPATVELLETVGHVVFITGIDLGIAIAAVTIVVHRFSGGSFDGTIGWTLAVVGWSYAPNLLAVPIELAFTIAGNLGESDASAIAVLDLGDGHVAFSSTGVAPIGLIPLLAVTIWSVYIIGYGVAAANDVPVRSAMGVAILVGIGSLLTSLL